MGLNNVNAAFLLWAHLDHGPFRLLSGMAARALDPPGGASGQEPYVYYDGEDAMVLIVGRSRTTMYRYLKTLIAEGAVELHGDGAHRGRRANYLLRVDPLARRGLGPVQRDMKGPVQRDASGRAARPVQRDPLPDATGPVKRDASEAGLGPVQRDMSVSRPTGHEGSRPTGHEGSRPTGHLGKRRRTKENRKEEMAESVCTDDRARDRTATTDEKPPSPEPEPRRLRVVADLAAYQRAHDLLVTKLGAPRATEAAMAYATEHDVDVRAAVVALAGRLEAGGAA